MQKQQNKNKMEEGKKYWLLVLVIGIAHGDKIFKSMYRRRTTTMANHSTALMIAGSLAMGNSSLTFSGMQGTVTIFAVMAGSRV